MSDEIGPGKCPECDGSGFSGRGTGYDDVCSTCGGQSAYERKRPIGHRTVAIGDGTFLAELIDDQGLRVKACAGFPNSVIADEWASKELMRFRLVDEWERRT